MLLTAEMVDRYSRENSSSIVMAVTVDIIATGLLRLTATYNTRSGILKIYTGRGVRFYSISITFYGEIILSLKK